VHTHKQGDKEMKNVAALVSESFIWAVGITRPRPGQERVAALYITLMLAGILVFAVCIFFLLMGHI
jgi:hypothetical protein